MEKPETPGQVRCPGYYAVIPGDVRYDDRIPVKAKLLCGEISALIGKEGYGLATVIFLPHPS